MGGGEGSVEIGTLEPDGDHRDAERALLPLALGIYTRRTGWAVHGLALVLHPTRPGHLGPAGSAPPPRQSPPSGGQHLNSVTRRTLTSLFDREWTQGMPLLTPYLSLLHLCSQVGAASRAASTSSNAT